MYTAQLNICDGPRCSRCGCNDTQIVQEPSAPEDGRGSWWPTGRAKCRYCGARFAFREVPAAAPDPPPLPQEDPPPRPQRSKSAGHCKPTAASRRPRR